MRSFSTENTSGSTRFDNGNGTVAVVLLWSLLLLLLKLLICCIREESEAWQRLWTPPATLGVDAGANGESKKSGAPAVVPRRLMGEGPKEPVKSRERETRRGGDIFY